MNKHYTATFEKLPDNKQQQIFAVAVAAFSKNGYAGASINRIAKDAKISIGAMYSYFQSKEQLFLAVVEQGKSILNQAISSLDTTRGDFFDTMVQLLKITIDYSKRYPDYVKLYHSLSTEALNDFSQPLTEALERDFIAFYRQLLNGAAARGELRAGLDLNYAALFVDNILVMLELSYANTYHMARMAQYLEISQAPSETDACNYIIDMLKRSLGHERYYDDSR